MSTRPSHIAERRDTPRVRAAIEAMIKHDDKPFQRFNTRDVSLDGAFVETGPHRLTGEDRLDVALKIPQEGGARVYRFGARVARVASMGVGVVFEHVNTESYAALLDFVFSRQPKGNR